MGKNTGKMTPIQVQMLVDILCENTEIASGQVTSTFSREERNKKWEAIATLLNSKGLGPEKTPEQWRKSWADLKCATRTKAAKCELAGGTDLMNDKLSTLEKRVLQLSGDITVQPSEKTENKQLTGKHLLKKLEADLIKTEEDLARAMKKPNQIALPISLSKVFQVPEKRNTQMPIVQTITAKNTNEQDNDSCDEGQIDDSLDINCDSYVELSYDDSDDDDIVYDGADSNNETAGASVNEPSSPPPKRRKVSVVADKTSSESKSLVSIFQRQIETQTAVLKAQTGIMRDIAESLRLIARSLHDS